MSINDRLLRLALIGVIAFCFGSLLAVRLTVPISETNAVVATGFLGLIAAVMFKD